MNLAKTIIGDDLKMKNLNLVKAKDLHTFLELERELDLWIEEKLSKKSVFIDDENVLLDFKTAEEVINEYLGDDNYGN